MEARAKLESLGRRFLSFWKGLPRRIAASFRGTGERIVDLYETFLDFLSQTDWKVRLSFLIMGSGNIFYGQIAKGIVFFLVEAIFVLYMAFFGGNYIVGLITLGTKQADPWTGTPGDNSIVLMLMGLITILFTFVFLAVYVASIKSAQKARITRLKGERARSFMEDVASLSGKSFPIVALVVPFLGVVIFSVIPIVMMVIVAFTNYGGDIQVPTFLVDYVGIENFVTIFSATNIGDTFFKILGWNLVWAFLSTFLNYFLGLGLALLLSKKCVKGRAFWRAFPILAYAIPGFITLIAFKFMFSVGGPINYYVTSGHLHDNLTIDFLGKDSTWTARLIGLFVNAWLTVPTTMLLATGILSNVQTDLYEAADIDGASKTRQFFDITLPYVVFATTPSLISQFIGNFNNFGTFYFLRGSIVSDGYFLSSDTDLLINWLYRLSIEKDYYSIGAAVSLLIFLITSAISLLVYVRSGSYKKEDTYR